MSISNTKKLPVAIILGVALVIGLLFIFSPSPPQKPAESHAPLVDTLTANPGTHSPTLTLFGQVESPFTTTLSSATSAFVNQVNVNEGDKVKKGELLVALDSTDAQLFLAQREADLQDVKAQIAQLENQYQADKKALKLEQELLALANKAAARYENLVKKNVGSDIQRDEALQSAKRQALSVTARELAVIGHENKRQRLQAQLQRAQALRDQAALDLERTRITAPFNGRVTKVLVSPQNRVRPGDPVVNLYDTDRIEVRAQIPARYLSQVRNAMQQGIQLTGFMLVDNNRLPLLLTRLAGNVSESRGGVDAFFSFQEQHTAIEIGRAAELHLTLAPVANTVAIPPMALYGQSRIYIINEKETLEGIEVSRIGEIVQDNGEPWILVQTDIQPGATILTTQLPNAISGLKVSVKKP